MIQNKREGFYVLIYFEAPADLIVELNRRFKLADKIMRNLVLQLNKEQIAEIFDEEAAKKRVARQALHSEEDDDEYGDDDVLEPGNRRVASTEE